VQQVDISMQYVHIYINAADKPLHKDNTG